MKQQRSGSRTLLMSVLMSAPGPLVVGLGLITGRSATQLADFVRRSAELAAIVVSFVVYRAVSDEATARKARLERRANLAVGAAMCLSGAVMLGLALLSPGGKQGNVIPGLVIAVLGVIANSIFWRRYTRLSRANGDAILTVQSRLYGAKAMVDGCVTAALLAVALFPGSAAAHLLDGLGSAAVAVYLILCGIRTLRQYSRDASL